MGVTWEDTKGQGKIKQRDERLWQLIFNQEVGKLEAGEDSMFEYIHTAEGTQLGWVKDQFMNPRPEHRPQKEPIEDPFNREQWYQDQRDNQPPPDPMGATWNPNIRAGGSGTQRRSNRKPRKRSR